MAKDGDTIVVWFSCGTASAVAAKKTIEKYAHRCTVRVVNNPIAEEHHDNLRFLKDVERWLGVKIESAVNDAYPGCSAVEVWAKRKFMAGVAGAPCTFELKKKARQSFEKDNKVDWHVLGFTAEEKHRSDRFILGERPNTIPVLIDEGISKGDCFNILTEAGLELPEVYRLGYPNANCIGCVKASSPTYWNHVRKVHPEVFSQRAVQSKELGARLVRVKGKRIFLEDLLVTDKGRSMKGLDFECGIFCEERT